MGILWFNFLVVYISSWLARYFSHPLDQYAPYNRPNKLLTLIGLVSLVTVSGLRRNIGDTSRYMHSYQVNIFSLHKINFKGDFGFDALQALLQSISPNPQILIFITSIIINVFIIFGLYKYSRMFEISLFVFIASGMYTVSMNGIRQSIAAAIIFASSKYIINGDWKKFLFIILFASTIHKSALIFIPIYFIVRRRAWTKVTWLLLFLAVLIALEFNTFSNLLFSVIEDTQYGHYKNFSAGGANIIRVFVTGIPLLIAFLGREKLRELWPKSDYIVNLSLLGFIFMVIATKNWIFARFDIYFSLYGLILISWIVHLFKNNQRYLIYYSIIICYLIYFYYEQVISLGITYKSDYLP